MILARATTENASLISNISISSFVKLHTSSTLLMAATGAVGKSIGARAASARPVCVCGGGGGGEEDERSLIAHPYEPADDSVLLSYRIIPLKCLIFHGF